MPNPIGQGKYMACVKCRGTGKFMKLVKSKSSQRPWERQAYVRYNCKSCDGYGYVAANG